MIIGIDFDDCLADLVSSWLHIYKLRSKHDLTKEELSDWDISLFVQPEFKKEIYTYIERPSIYNSVKEILGAKWAYNYLVDAGNDVLIITHSTLGCAGRKYEWLIDNGFDVPHDNYIECKRKELIDVDILIDDRFENVRDTKGLGILINQPWNAKCGG